MCLHNREDCRSYNGACRILFREITKASPINITTLLLLHDLVVYSKEEKRFRITRQGIYALDMYTKIDELLVRRTLHKMTKMSEYFASFP